MPWRGTWGALSDGRSKVSRLARTITGELLGVYAPSGPLAARLLAEAAAFMALATAARARVGTDEKATLRAASGASRAADRRLARLDALGCKRAGPLTSAERAPRKAGHRG